jgi:hypothetical protein
LSELGHVVKVNWKAWRYNTKEVFFEVRSVLDDFFEKDETSWETARVLKKQMGIVKEVFEMLGLKFWGEFLPNHKSYISNKDVFDNESVPTKFIRNEFSVSTLGLVVWLAVWSENRKGRFDKDKLRAMLNAFFTLELDPSSFFFDRLVSKYDAEFDACSLRTDQIMPCRCLRYEMQHIENTYKNWRWYDFITLVVGTICDTTCDAFVPVGNRLVREVAFMANVRIQGATAADPLRDMVAFYTNTGKRRRIDEDFKQDVSHLSTSSELKPMEVCKQTGICAKTGIKEYKLEAVKSMRLASQRTLTCEGVTILADDSSGHGKPSESTLLSLIFDAEKNKMTPGQPMVSIPVFATQGDRA